jgi:hypothetical protein
MFEIIIIINFLLVLGPIISYYRSPSKYSVRLACNFDVNLI